ncbi:MAG: SH3 domain-containing protein [Chloroflexi bacterium]|nr:SH3 domain-containing protein [Chloroflexota bacterium]MCY4246434.1 SH3 domain-containing protein [Chloroflexota bacterium]
MRRIAVLILAMLCLSLALPAARAQSATPLCTRAEFLAVFDQVVDYQARFADPPSDFAALMTYSQQYASDRLTTLAQLPQCAEALEFGALLVQMGGDFAARAALELAGTPSAGNPYLALPDREKQINDRLAAMLENDRSLAQAPEQRQLPACTAQQLEAYAAAATDLIDILATANSLNSRAAFSALLDERLAWRASRLPVLPLCAETLALGQALNAALTDSMTSLSFAFVGVPAAENPFIALAEFGMQRISAWQTAAGSSTALAAAPPIEKRRLPACSRDQLDSALTAIDRDFLSTFAATTDALERSHLHLAYRGGTLSRLPVCAEAFAVRWWLDEWLGAPTEANRSRRDDALLRLEAARAPMSRQSVACSEADLRFLAAYITPAFHNLMRAALSTAAFAQQPALEQQSQAFRALLWAHLPPCDDAVRLGLQMRGIAADFVAAVKLEATGAFAVEIPYTLDLPSAIARLSERLSAIETALGIGETQTWFVDVEGFANVRSCGSTVCGVMTVVQGGEPLEVLDDSGDWFELRLSNGRTGYIAAFLVSEDPLN